MLELIKRWDNNKWYWCLDMRYEDDSDGAYGNSVDYDSDKEAIKALFDNKVEWIVSIKGTWEAYDDGQFKED